jgi:hypothetical protein
MLFAVVAAVGLQQPTASRRAIGAGLAAAVLPPAAPAFANNAGAAKVASGYVAPPRPVDVVFELKTKFYEPLSGALSRGDWAAVGSSYLPTATLVDGTVKGAKIAFLKGSEASGSFSGRGLSGSSIGVGNVPLARA